MNSARNGPEVYAPLPRLRRLRRSLVAEKNYKLLIYILSLNELDKSAINK